MISDAQGEALQKLISKYNVDKQHAETVRRLAAELFERLSNFHGLGIPELKLLSDGALLHDLGTYVAHKKHHKHSAYLVLHDSLLNDYPQRERILLSLLVENHRKKVKLPPLPAHYDRMILPVLIAILRIADALDYMHHDSADIREVRQEETKCFFVITGLELSEIERHLLKKAAYFSEVFGLDPVFLSRDVF